MSNRGIYTNLATVYKSLDSVLRADGGAYDAAKARFLRNTPCFIDRLGKVDAVTVAGRIDVNAVQVDFELGLKNGIEKMEDGWMILNADPQSPSFGACYVVVGKPTIDEGSPNRPVNTLSAMCKEITAPDGVKV